MPTTTYSLADFTPEQIDKLLDVVLAVTPVNDEDEAMLEAIAQNLITLKDGMVLQSEGASA